MQQSALTLAPLPRVNALPSEAIGFDIGWQHAQHGLVPAAELLQEGTAVDQGWRAARTVLGRRNLASTRALRQWLMLRSLAWRQGVDFDTTGLGPAELARLETGSCPVRRRPLGGAASSDDAPVFFRLDLDAGYRLGNLVVLSRAAALAAQELTAADALRLARDADASAAAVRGLHAAAWRRLAALLSFARAGDFHEAARLPLLVLPPPGIQPRHALQELQLLLSLQFLRPGWSARTRALAATLPQDAQRTEFHLFVSAFASRVLEAGAHHCAGQDRSACRTALEDAWLRERVQRRWLQLALALGEVACAALLQRVQALQEQSDQDPALGLRRQRASAAQPEPAPIHTSPAATRAPAPSAPFPALALAPKGQLVMPRKRLGPQARATASLQAQA